MRYTAWILMFAVALGGAFAQTTLIDGMNETNETNTTENNTTIGNVTDVTTVSENATGNMTEQNETINETNVTGGMQNTTVNETNVTLVNQTTTENETTFTPTATLYVKEPYPKGLHYVFVCDSNFNATTYDWYYGDGHKLLGITNGDTYHIYERNGNYAVSCTAYGENMSATTTGGVQAVSDVPPGEAELVVKAWYPKQNHYVFECRTPAFTPTAYNWYYGDGEKLLNIQNGDTYHIYEQTGTYNVSCEGLGENNQFARDDLTVTVTSVMENSEDTVVSIVNSTNVTMNSSVVLNSTNGTVNETEDNETNLTG